jgi:hypothetical protein
MNGLEVVDLTAGHETILIVVGIKPPCDRRSAFAFALESTGRSNAARIPIMAMTTSSSTKVNAHFCFAQLINQPNYFIDSPSFPPPAY